MKNILRALLPLVVLLLAGCCANDVCNCNDQFADSLYFTFNTSSTDPNAFTASDLDTVYLVRYASGAARRASDSTAVIHSQDSSRTYTLRQRLKKLPPYTLLLSDNYPFAPGSTGKLSQFTYQLRVRLGDQRTNPVYVYTINNIRLAGHYKADGCCTCYENQGKSAFVRNTYTDLTEQNNTPVVVTLSKY